MKTFITSKRVLRKEAKVICVSYKNQLYNVEVPIDAQISIKKFTDYYSKVHLKQTRINVINTTTNKYINKNLVLFDYYNQNNEQPIQLIDDNFTEETLLERGIKNFPFNRDEFSSNFQSYLNKIVNEESLLKCEFKESLDTLLKKHNYYQPTDRFANQTLLGQILISI